jgi:hypothetical protein
MLEFYNVLVLPCRFEKQLMGLTGNARSVLPLIEDLAPHSSRDKLEAFVLQHFTPHIESGKICHEGISSIQYAEIMCPSDIWRNRYNFFGQ